MCVMFLAVPQSRQSFPVNVCLKDSCRLGKGRWISEPYWEYSWNSKMLVYCLSFSGAFIVPCSRILTYLLLPVLQVGLMILACPNTKTNFMNPELMDACCNI